jgi:hypothetical protein
MVKNHDAGDVRGLEEVFRAQELRRVLGPAGDAPAGSARAAERPSKTVLGLASMAVAGSRRDDGVGPQGGPGQGATPALSLDRRLMAERQVQTTSSGGGAALGEASVAVSAEPPGKRETGRYWTLGSVSALVALVVAGVAAGAGQHPAAHASAQGRHATVRPHDGFHTSGAASTGPTAPGSLTGAVGVGRAGRGGCLGQRATWARDLERCRHDDRDGGGIPGQVRRQTAAAFGRQRTGRGRVFGDGARKPSRDCCPCDDTGDRRGSWCRQHGRAYGGRNDIVTTANCGSVAR